MVLIRILFYICIVHGWSYISLAAKILDRLNEYTSPLSMSFMDECMHLIFLREAISFQICFLLLFWDYKYDLLSTDYFRFMASNNSISTSTTTSAWTKKQNKIFEKALAVYDKDAPDRWKNISRQLDGKSEEDVKRHYVLLVEDVRRIESGFVAYPYASSARTNNQPASDTAPYKWSNSNCNLILLNIIQYYPYSMHVIK